MYVRRHRRAKNGKPHTYWSLVESRRTAKGPRNRIVAYLGEIAAADREGWVSFTRDIAGRALPVGAMPLFPAPAEADAAGDDPVPETVTVNVSGVAVDGARDFGDVWLATVLWRSLQLDRLFARRCSPGHEGVPWPLLFAILAFARFCAPASELHICEQWYPRTALPLLFGVPAEAIHPNRLYRALDRLLPHKTAIEQHLQGQLGALFQIDYDLLLYDITSTYFEGDAARNPPARYGHSRDKRSDCRQICLGLVVTRDGLPLGYEVFAGNRSDKTTVAEIVAGMEARYGRANRLWVMDRGMVTEENLAVIRARHGRYIVGASRTELPKFEQELLARDWTHVYDDLEVKLCDSPDGTEKFVLCRSAGRAAKERAMHDRCAQRIVAGLERLAARLARTAKRPDRAQVERQIGRLLQRNAHSAGRYNVTVDADPARPGHLVLTWTIATAWDAWMALRDGAYILRTNILDLDGETLWKMYTQLTDVEDSFRTLKSDLRVRPIYHQTESRVQAHILVAFLAYALWKTLDRWCVRDGLGRSARKVLAELRGLKCVRVRLPTSTGRTLTTHCVTRPDPGQQVLLSRLRLEIPARLGAPRWLDVRET